MKRTRSSAASEVEFDVDDFLEATKAQGTDMDSVILGIDEAGRGPTLGDMVYSGAIISLAEHDKILDAGANDSKMLKEHERERCRGELEKIPTLVDITIPLSAEKIAEAMFSRHGQNLNTLSHETAVKIINEASIKARGRLAAVYIDTVGPPESYQRMLQGRFPHLLITVAKKADSKFPIVSAASIFAKTTRDRSIVALAEEHGDMGCGYPSDPKTVKFLKSKCHKFFVVPPERASFVRQSWGPVIAIARSSACVPLEWELTDDKEKKEGGGRLSGGGDGAEYASAAAAGLGRVSKAAQQQAVQAARAGMRGPPPPPFLKPDVTMSRMLGLRSATTMANVSPGAW